MNDTEVGVTDLETERRRAGAERAEAFARLSDRQLLAAYRLAALLLGSEAEAEDATHDAAVVAWERFSTLHDVDRFEAWFQRILVNACRDRLRRRRLIPWIPISDTQEPRMREPRMQDGLAGLAERDALRRAVASLSPDHRVVVVLRYFADLTIDEIAKRLGERQGTVKSRLHYALGALRAAYDAADRIEAEAIR